MATCKNCGKKGLFLHLNSNGLCKICENLTASSNMYNKAEDQLINHSQSSKNEYQTGIDAIHKVIMLYNSAYNYNCTDDFNSAIDKCNEIRHIAKELSCNSSLKKVIDKQLKYDTLYDRNNGIGKIEGLPMSINTKDSAYPYNIPEALCYIADICEKRIHTQYDKIIRLSSFPDILENIEIYPITLSNEKIKKNAISDINDIVFSSVTSKSNYERLGNFVVIDVETTGLTASKDEIIEVAAIKFEEWLPVCKFSTLVKPKKEIPFEITNINGISNNMVSDAPTIQSIIPSLRDFIGRSSIVGHNLLFDIKFLYKNGLDFFEEKRKYYDTLELSQKVLKKQSSSRNYDYDVKNYKLTTLCNYYSIREEKYSHRAASDCLATGYLFNILTKERIGIED